MGDDRHKLTKEEYTHNRSGSDPNIYQNSARDDYIQVDLEREIDTRHKVQTSKTTWYIGKHEKLDLCRENTEGELHTS